MSAEQRAEVTVKKSNLLVVIKESQHLESLTMQEAMLRDSNDLELAAEARKIRKEVNKEHHRVYDNPGYDEEEARLFILSQKKK